MSSLCEDLDHFLKTDGVKIIMDSSGTRVKPWKPLNIEGFGCIDDIEPDGLDESSLNNLLSKAEDIRSHLDDRLSEIEDFIDRLQDRLDSLEQ